MSEYYIEILQALISELKVNGLKLSKLIIPLLLIFLFLVTVVFLFLPGSREYTKLNIVYYYLYSFDEIKEIPMISGEYKINYEPVDGGSGEFNDIVFFNVDAERTMNSLIILNIQVSLGSLTNTGRENDGLRIIQKLILSSMNQNKPHRSWWKKN
ncbi:hypothetical protein [Morganella morganii]|uniref:hypothetical protein n=1 Tax=Morganella morganii TaxID=582 RepID=UPI0032DA1CE4